MVNVAIIGAGAIGSLFGGLLAEKSHEVVLIGKNPHVGSIRENGLFISSGNRDFSVDVDAVVDTPDKNFDLVVFATKSYDTEDALFEHSDLFDKETLVLSIQNGIGNEEVLHRFNGIGSNNVVGGVTSNGASIVEPGRISWNGVGRTVVGDERVRNILEGIQAPVNFNGNIEGVIWGKALINCGINPIGALTGFYNGEIVEYLKDVLVKVVEEGIEVAEEKEIELEFDPVSEIVEVCRNTSDNKNSMLQDIEANKKTEIDYMNGVISGSDVFTPYNDLLFNLVKSIDCYRFGC